jgi:hypothetical protein
VQLSGELSKVNLPNLLQLVKTGGLTGKISFSQGARTASVLVSTGFPVHVEAEGHSGFNALMELFLWSSGTFSFSEEPVNPHHITIPPDDPAFAFERLLRDGVMYAEQKHYLEEIGITPKSVLKPTGTAVTFAKQVLAPPGLEHLDGRKTLAEALGEMHLTRKEFVNTVASWLVDGLADLVEESEAGTLDRVELPAWVVARLAQDNPDISQAIIDMVIWVDRVKCWMYQVDADFYRIRKQISQSAGTSSTDGEDDDENSVSQVFGAPAPPSDNPYIYGGADAGHLDVSRRPSGPALPGTRTQDINREDGSAGES